MTQTMPRPAPRTDGGHPHFGARLNSSDALLWSIEGDPKLRTTIVAVSVLDRSPDWRRLHQRMTEACILVPRLRQRVIEMPLRMGTPRWELDERFQLDDHLHRVELPRGSSLRAALDIAGRMAAEPFDRSRPLWEFTLIEGLTRHRSVFVQKLHHCLTDGIGAVEMAIVLFDANREPLRRDPGDDRTADELDELDELPGAGWLAVAASLQEDARAAVESSLRAARSMPGRALHAAADPGDAVRGAVGQARSVAKLLAPVTRPLSTVMTGRSQGRRLDTFEMPIADLLAAAHAADCSLNDAFLAGIAGGMRRYHDKHGAPVPALRVTMPINIRTEDDAAGSNRFTPARFALPIGTLDPIARMRELGALAANWRREPSLPLTDTIAGVLDRLPVAVTTSVFGSLLKGIDFVATNVPGMRDPVFLAGAHVVRQYAFAPPSGAALSIALLSHLDQCCIGVNVDTAAVVDPELMITCLRAGFDEVLAIGTTP